jgi:hypothetical protein
MDIPEDVKRRLRQEAGFGCCKCGLPVFQYHHIIPREVEDHNRPEDMMVLCPNHHWEVTSGAMLEEEQRCYKAQPFNIARRFADGLLKVNQTYCVIAVGSCELINDAAVVLVDGESLLGLSIVEERLNISVALYDEEDRLLLLIDQNEWLTGDPAVWDIEATHQKFVLRMKPRDVRLSIDASVEPMRVQASLRRAGQRIDFRPKGIEINGVVKEAGMSALGLVGFRIVIDTAAAQLPWSLIRDMGSGRLYQMRFGLSAFGKVWRHSRNCVRAFREHSVRRVCCPSGRPIRRDEHPRYGL